MDITRASHICAGLLAAALLPAAVHAQAPRPRPPAPPSDPRVEIVFGLADQNTSDRTNQFSISTLRPTRGALSGGGAVRWLGDGVNFVVRGDTAIDMPPDGASGRFREFDVDASARIEWPFGLHVGYAAIDFLVDDGQTLSVVATANTRIRSLFQGPEIGMSVRRSIRRLYYSVDFEGYPALLEQEHHSFQLTGEPMKSASRTNTGAGLREEGSIGVNVAGGRLEAFSRLRILHSRRGDPLEQPSGMNRVTVSYGGRVTWLVGRR